MPDTLKDFIECDEEEATAARCEECGEEFKDFATFIIEAERHKWLRGHKLISYLRQDEE